MQAWYQKGYCRRGTRRGVVGVAPGGVIAAMVPEWVLQMWNQKGYCRCGIKRDSVGVASGGTWQAWYQEGRCRCGTRRGVAGVALGGLFHWLQMCLEVFWCPMGKILPTSLETAG